MCAYEGKAYAIGGNDGTRDLKTVEVYDPQLNTWSILSLSCCHPAHSTPFQVTREAHDPPENVLLCRCRWREDHCYR
jgi:hypothetical protein